MISKRVRSMEASNIEAAGIIASRPADFGGAESLMVRWAELVLSKHAGALVRAA
jgi:hypothetical protein